MHFHQHTHSTAEARATSPEGAPVSANQKLDAAREADAAWRASRSVQLTEGLARLNRSSRRSILSLWGLAGTALGFGILLMIRAMFEPPEPRWGTTLSGYLIVGCLCLIASLALAFTAVLSGFAFSWLRRRFRARAAAEGVVLDD